MKRAIIKLSIPVLLVFVFSSFQEKELSTDQKSKQDPPNIIFILADDLGYSEVGCYGNTFNETPFIDQLASEGLRFTDAYASAPVCSPYRASLFTGFHPARIGITDYLRPHEDRHLDEEYTTLAEMFQIQGYMTGMIGKWHLTGYEKNGAKESGPGKHGFEEVILTEQRGISGGTFFFPYHFNDTKEQKIKPVEHLTDRINLEAVEFIERNNPAKTGKPLFLFKSHYSVHTNLNGKKLYVDQFSLKENAGISPESNKNNVHLAAQLKSIDDGVGMLVRKLKELGIYDNTIIIFTSDNGGETNVTSNAPLRAGKSTLYEGGIRISLIISWPEVMEKSMVTDYVTSNLDYFPTFQELTDFSPEKKIDFDGRSILGLITDPSAHQTEEQTLYWHYPLNSPHFLGGFSSGAIRDGDYKLIEDYTSGEVFLYNLRKDLGETNDVKSQNPDVADRLYSELVEWRKDLELEKVKHTKPRKAVEALPEPGDDIILEINHNEVPFMNYNVTKVDDGMYFTGDKSFLKLLHIYIPDVTAQTVSIGARFTPECSDGVIVAHGEEVFGLSVYLKEGKVHFSTRKYGVLTTLKDNREVSGETTVLGKLTKQGDMELMVNGKKIAETNIGESLPIPPDDPLSIGCDFRRLIGEYGEDNYYKGTISDVIFEVE